MATATTTSNAFSFTVGIPIHDCQVLYQDEPAFTVRLMAPFLLDEFVGSGQYVRQLERLAAVLRTRAWNHDDNFVRIVDCGANVGLFPLFAEQILGPVSATLFDPVELNLGLAQQNLAQIPNVCFAVALGAEPGIQTLHVMSTTGCSLMSAETTEWELETGREALRVEVAVDTLDSFTLGRVDLIKLDVEGAEQDVLEGARELLDRDRPYVICSYEHPSNDVGAITALLETRGYDWEDDIVNKLLTFSPRA